MKWEIKKLGDNESMFKYYICIEDYDISINDWSNRDLGIFVHVVNQEINYVYSFKSEYNDINIAKKEALNLVENNMYKIYSKYRDKYDRVRNKIKHIEEEIK